MIAYDPDDPGGKVQVYQGDYTTFRRIHAVEAEKRKAAERQLHSAPSPERKTTKKAKLTYAEKMEFDGIEAAIEQAEERVTELESALAAPDIWSGDPKIPQQLQSDLEAAREEAEHLMERWEYLSLKAEGSPP